MVICYSNHRKPIHIVVLYPYIIVPSSEMFEELNLLFLSLRMICELIMLILACGRAQNLNWEDIPPYFIWFCFCWKPEALPIWDLCGLFPISHDISGSLEFNFLIFFHCSKHFFYSRKGISTCPQKNRATEESHAGDIKPLQRTSSNVLIVYNFSFSLYYFLLFLFPCPMKISLHLESPTMQ